MEHTAEQRWGCLHGRCCHGSVQIIYISKPEDNVLGCFFFKCKDEQTKSVHCSMRSLSEGKSLFWPPSENKNDSRQFATSGVSSEAHETDGNQRCNEMCALHEGEANGVNTEAQRRNNKEQRSSSLGSRSAGCQSRARSAGGRGQEWLQKTRKTGKRCCASYTLSWSGQTGAGPEGDRLQSLPSVAVTGLHDPEQLQLPPEVAVWNSISCDTSHI